MALPLGKLTILVGAGIVGSVLAKEGRMSNVSDFFSGALKIVLKQIQRDDSSPLNAKPQNNTLLDQVNSLRQELQKLAPNRSVTIITGSRSGARTYGAPVLVVVVVGYGYIWWKGWKLSDMMFATRRSLVDVSKSVANQLEQVHSSISTAKRYLSSRIDRVDGNLDECAETISSTREEVSLLRGDLRTCGVDVESVHRAVQTLEEKIGRIEGKQDLTNGGIKMLCEFVWDLENGRAAERIQASPFSSSRPALEHTQFKSASRTGSLPSNVPSLELPSPSTSNGSPKVLRPLQNAISESGLKELQGITDSNVASPALDVSNGTRDSEDTNSNSSSSYSRLGWRLPSLNASFISRTHNATRSFK